MILNIDFLYYIFAICKENQNVTQFARVVVQQFLSNNQNFERDYFLSRKQFFKTKKPLKMYLHCTPSRMYWSKFGSPGKLCYTVLWLYVVKVCWYSLHIYIPSCFLTLGIHTSILQYMV